MQSWLARLKKGAGKNRPRFVVVSLLIVLASIALVAGLLAMMRPATGPREVGYTELTLVAESGTVKAVHIDHDRVSVKTFRR